MKKQFKTAVIAAALMASTTGVFASDIANVFTGKVLVEYTWETFDENGNSTGTDIPGDEDSYASCSGDGPTCAVGTAPGELPIVRKYVVQ
jgi:hypothetical protein